MNIEELCEKIGLLEDTKKRLDEFSADFNFAPLKELIEGLAVPEKSEECYKALTEALGDDPLGMKILACYLRGALVTFENYKKAGIDEGVFVDTMKCFTRFINEDIEREDKPSFGRAFWSYRHLNCTLLRIGTLEYELIVRNGERKISVHIPSDADLSPSALDFSFDAAEKLIGDKFPDYAEAPVICESWLMAPVLHKLLPEGSKILGFQNRFEIVRENAPSKNALVYIFHRANIGDYKDLPESTSLQRAVKKFLLGGGGIGSAYAVLKRG